MYEPIRRRMLALLKVPPQPHPPSGEPASLRVFRAGRNYFRLRLFTWIVTQSIALAGIIFWATVFIQVEAAVQTRRAERAAARAAASSSSTPASPAVAPTQPPAAGSAAPEIAKVSFPKALASAVKKPHQSGWAGFKQPFVELALLLPLWTFPLLWALKILGCVIYLVQIPITYVARRLDYEMHWYMVTDRSLRLRTGIWKVQELTMSFANLQQVVVSQGPLQRFLGVADVRVQSAGGADSENGRGTQQTSMHSGYFHSVDNAAEIRDLILERLRRFRETGLGDPDEKRLASAPDPVRASASETDLLTAAREFRDEARALRAAIISSP